MKCYNSNIINLSDSLNILLIDVEASCYICRLKLEFLIMFYNMRSNCSQEDYTHKRVSMDIALYPKS